MKKLSTFLWFDNQAEAAAKFYVSIFKGAKITATSYYGDAGPQPAGSVMVVAFTIAGQRFQAINGGPHYQLTPAVSLVVPCDDQKEVDLYWSKLVRGGKGIQCGWLQDKFGLSWQIVPTLLPKLLASKNKPKAAAATQAMFGMVKLDIAKLQKAYDAG